MSEDPSRLIDIVPSAQGAVLSFDRCIAANAVLRERRQELLCQVVRVAKRATVVRRVPGRDAVELADTSHVGKILPDIRLKVDSVAHRPCPPHMVDALLGIRSMERIRWTKDGRLGVAGSVPLRGASGAWCPVYKAVDIAALAASKSIIEDWRYRDALDRIRR